MALSQPEDSAVITTAASSISTAQEVELLDEQVEFLSTQVDSLHQMVEQLNRELLGKQKQIQDLEQELAQTNRELCQALALSERETDESQLWREQANKVDNKRKLYVDELEIDKIAAKIDPQIGISTKRAIENAKEAIARTQQLKERFNEFGVHFVGSQANCRKLREQRDEIATQAQQPEGEQLIFERIKQYNNAYRESLEQFQAQQRTTQELSKQTKLCLKQIKVELAKLSDPQKNILKARFCLAEACF